MEKEIIKKMFLTLKEVQEKERNFNDVCGNPTTLFTSIKNGIEEMIFTSYGIEYDSVDDEVVDIYNDVEKYMKYYEEYGKLNKLFCKNEISYDDYREKKNKIECYLY